LINCPVTSVDTMQVGKGTPNWAQIEFGDVHGDGSNNPDKFDTWVRIGHTCNIWCKPPAHVDVWHFVGYTDAEIDASVTTREWARDMGYEWEILGPAETPCDRGHEHLASYMLCVRRLVRMAPLGTSPE
jgi:hypothetical protein